ncbi:MAG: indole-3-glycerol phosphate synthase TrpC [Pseudomonadota bacterium]
MSDILDKILAVKADEIKLLANRYSRSTLEALGREHGTTRGFIRALTAKVAAGEAGVIAEIKKASPSKGLIRADFDPGWIAREYAAGGAACLSVLTDEQFFQGHNAFLIQARASCTLPAIRKDFLIDELQIAEARAIGADCVLLIVAALTPQQLESLAAYAVSLGMDVLVEIHDRAELEVVLKAKLPPPARDGAQNPVLLGINNRNLRTFEVSLSNTLDLLADIPQGTDVVTESGIVTSADVQKMRAAGVHRFLVGESLMRQAAPGAALKTLVA